MAHFAELDENNVVKRVIVVANKDTSDANGVEKESIGIAHCEWLLGGRWVQTSYNGNFRKHYAGKGYTFDADRDAFIPPKPYPSWVLDEDTCLWEPPIPAPEGDDPYDWDEESQSWVLVEQPE